MASEFFDQPFSLLLRRQDDVVVGLEPFIDDDDIIVTSIIRGVSIYKTREQKQIFSWATKLGQKFTCPVVYDIKTNSLIGVINEKTIYTWSIDATSLENADRTLVHKCIHKIYTDPVQQTVPLVIYKDGTFENMSEVGDGSPSTTKMIKWCNVLCNEGKCCVVRVTEKNDVTASWTNGDDIIERSFHLTSPSHDDADQSQLISISTYGNMLITLWSNGAICQHTLSQQEEVAVPDLCVDCLKDSYCLVGLNKELVAITGTKKDTQQTGVCVWDTKFNLLHAWISIPDLDKETKIHNVVNNLYLCCIDCVKVVPYCAQPVKLMSAITRPHLELIKIVNDDFVTEISCYSDFKAMFDKMIGSIKEVNERARINQLTNATLQLCLVEKDFWPRDEIKNVITTLGVTSRMYQELVIAIINQNDIPLLHLAVQYMEDLPENLLVKCLDYYLGLDNTCFNETFDMENCENTEADKDCPYCLAKCIMVNTLLDIPFNGVFLLDELKTNFMFKEALSLLKYLYHLISKSSDADDVIQMNNNNKEPSILKIISWVGFLLDAHFTQFILSQDAHKVLVDLLDLVEKKKISCEDLGTMDSVLLQLKLKAAVPSKQSSGLYTIEVLHIP